MRQCCGDTAGATNHHTYADYAHHRAYPFRMSKKPITPEQRMQRMREMFEREHAVLAEDYDFFTRTLSPHTSPDAPKNQSKAPCMSVGSSGKLGPKSS